MKSTKSEPGIASPPPTAEQTGLISMQSALFQDVSVSLEAILGQASLSVSQLLSLRAGCVVPLDLQLNELVELRLNTSLVARGEIVAVDDSFGVRIVEIAAAQ